MPNKMLIDATHPEETRVVVLRGNRVEEFDFESANRKQLRGNIYLAKVTRVEGRQPRKQRQRSGAAAPVTGRSTCYYCASRARTIVIPATPRRRATPFRTM